MSKGPEPRATSASKTSSTDAAREKTFLDKWVEPDLRSASSYQDHGGLPYGVLEHMQPLGEAPNAKVKARVKVDGARKSALGRSAAAAGWDAQETPEGTPGPPASSQPTTNGQFGGRGRLGDAKDDNYAAVITSDVGRPTRTRAAAKRTQETVEQVDPTPLELFDSIYDEARPESTRVMSDRKIRQVLNHAKRHALDWHRIHIADALEELWDAAKKDDRIMTLIEAHLQTTINAQEAAEFDAHFKQAKKRARRKARHARKQRENGEDNVTIKAKNGPRLLSLRAPNKPPADAGDASTSATRDRGKTTERSNSTSRRASATVHSTTALPSTEPAALPRPRLSLKVKSPNKPTNNTNTHHHHHRTSHHTHKSTSTPKKKRTGSVGSDSSLTSLTSHGEDAMEVDGENNTRHTGNKSRHANASDRKANNGTRGGLAPDTRPLKRTSADAELVEDEQQKTLTAKKRRLQERVVREVPSQESSIRRSLRDSATRAQSGKAASSAAAALRASSTRRTPAKGTTRDVSA
ncbi:MAG: hypothetical protein INR71_12395, partial [Terriglobus roseus]|nr:hypothetical protein [Terriglobus roseus]